MFDYIYPLMPTRMQGLVDAQAGFEQTHAPLVGFKNGVFFPINTSDDPGLYYFIPIIERTFHLSINDASIVFFVGSLILAGIVSIVGIFLWIKNPIARLYAVILLYFLARAALVPGDIYFVALTTAIAIVPLFMYIMDSKKHGRALFIFLIVAGLLIGTSHMIRSHAATAPLILMACLLMSASHLTMRDKALSLAALIGSIAVPIVLFAMVYHQRDAAIMARNPDYEIPMTGHPFWHSAYLGLSYTGQNKYGIVWNDTFAKNKAQSIDPNVNFAGPRAIVLKYEYVLRNEYLRILKTDPHFVFNNYIAKIKELYKFFKKWINIGILALILRPKPLRIELSFLLAVAFASLSGLIVMPWDEYLVSFITMCALYSVASVGFLLDNGVHPAYARFGRRLFGFE